MKEIKIISFSNPTKEGINLHFNKKFSLNGGLPTDTWYMSWDKISQLFNRALNKDSEYERGIREAIGICNIEIVSLENELNQSNENSKLWCNGQLTEAIAIKEELQSKL